MRKCLVAVLVAASLFVAQEADAWQLAIGRSVGRHNVDVSLRNNSYEIEYIDEGVQMGGIPNRNRVINVDKVSTLILPYGSLFVKYGLTTSRYSTYGGPGPHMPDETWFSGQNLGIGVDFPLTTDFSIRAQTVWLHYRQCDIPAYERYTYTSISAVLSF